MYVTSIEITNASPASTQEWIGVVRKESLEISVEANGKASTASMEALIDISRDGANYSVSPQNEIVITGCANAQVVNDVGFEDGAPGWQLESGWSINTTDALHGGKCLQGNATSAVTVALYRVPCSPGDPVTLSAFARSTVNVTANGCELYIGFRTADLSTYLGGTSVEIPGGVDSWAKYEVSYTAPASSGWALLYVQLRNTATSGRVLVDDMIATIGTPVTLFSGYISRVEPQVIGPDSIRYRISCQDNTRLLDTVVVASESYTSKTDEYILDDLFSTYLPGVTTTGVQSVATLDSITFENLTLRQCVERICDRTGAEWRLGFDDDLKYYDITDNDGAFDFSDDADGSTTEWYLQNDFGYQEEFSTPANDVSVVGYQAPKPDPTTTELSVSADADDGYVQYSNVAGVGDTSPPDTGDSSVVATTGIDYLKLEYTSKVSSNVYSLGLIRFDTSGIPDGATILSAVLSLRLYYGVLDSSSMEFGIAYYAGSNWPINNPDDYTTAYISPGSATPDAVSWRYVNRLSVGASSSTPGANSFTLSNLSSISKTGYTGFRLVLGVTGGTSGDNYIYCVTRESSRADWRPKLTVTYQSPQPDPVTGSYTDSTSVALYGTFEKTINDPQATTSAECDDRAMIETQRFGYPRKSINCTFDRDGLEVGDTVHFTSSLLGIDDDFVVQRLRMRWPGKQAATRYYAELGQARLDLIEYLRKLK